MLHVSCYLLTIMGHKVSPIATRIPLTKRWQSHWFAQHKRFADKLKQDLAIRTLIERNYGDQAAIAKIELAHRQADIEVVIQSARPGVLIGRQGQGIAEIRRLIERKLKTPVKVEIQEVRRPELIAKLVAQSIAQGLSKNVTYRRVAKQALDKTMQAGALGIKIQVAGRLGGREIARREKFSEGLIPSTSLKKEIDFATHHLQTSYGTIGIKVWIYKQQKPEEA